MQEATVIGQGRESCASVQSDPDGARVVVACDRCPRELECPRELGFTAGVAMVSAEYRAKWTEVAVQTGRAPTKLLTLCPDCTKTFRLFMLGASIGRDVGESWEQIIGGEVRS